MTNPTSFVLFIFNVISPPKYYILIIFHYFYWISNSYSILRRTWDQNPMCVLTDVVYNSKWSWFICRCCLFVLFIGVKLNNHKKLQVCFPWLLFCLLKSNIFQNIQQTKPYHKLSRKNVTRKMRWHLYSWFICFRSSILKVAVGQARAEWMEWSERAKLIMLKNNGRLRLNCKDRNMATGELGDVLPRSVATNWE